MGDETDEQLMLRYGQGDLGAFDLLYRRHKGPLFRYVARQVHDRAAAEEIYQDVWFSLVRVRSSYEVRAKFSTWLYRMARNRVVDWYRATGRRGELPLEQASGAGTARDGGDEGAGHNPDPPDSGSPSPEQRLDADRAAARLAAAVAALPPEQRDAFLLQEESGLSLAEIAAVTGVGRETVKSRLRYAVAKLRAAVEWSGEETA